MHIYNFGSVNQFLIKSSFDLEAEGGNVLFEIMEVASVTTYVSTVICSASSAPFVLEKLNVAFNGVQSFTGIIGELIKMIREQLDGDIETYFRDILLQCKEQLRESLDCAAVYMKRVERLYKFANLPEDDVKKIKTAIEVEKNFDDYTAFIQQIWYYMKQIDKLHKTFEVIHVKATATCEKGRTEAEEKRKHQQELCKAQLEEKKDKENTGFALKLIGMTTGVGGVVALTAFSFLTAGIGAPIVFGVVAAAGTTAAGVGIAAQGVAMENEGKQSQSMIEQKKRTEEFLGKVKESFHKMIGYAENVDEAMRKAKTIVKDIKLSIKNVEAAKEDAKESHFALLRQFQQFVEGFGEGRKKVEKCQQDIMSYSETLADMKC